MHVCINEGENLLKGVGIGSQIIKVEKSKSVFVWFSFAAYATGEAML